MGAFLLELPIGLHHLTHEFPLPSSVPWTRRTQPISTAKTQDNETLFKKS